MAAEMEKPRVTEIRVRMDCNGCVQKIKKALSGVAGISDIYIDFPQHKITVIGWADPQKIVKAIKKTRKTAIICLHTEQPPPSSGQPPEQPPPEGGAPQADPTSQPPPEPQKNDESAPEPPQEHPPPENTPPPPPQHTEPDQSPKPTAPSQSGQPPPYQPKDHEEIHVIHHHHQPDYGYRTGYWPNIQQGSYYGHWNPHRGGPQFREGPSHPPSPHQPEPVYVTHSYNTYKPSPYVTEYAYPSSPSYSRYGVPENYTRYGAPDEYACYSVPDEYARYRAPENYTRAYYGDGNNGNGNVTSMFSEENPNACTIA